MSENAYIGRGPTRPFHGLYLLIVAKFILSTKRQLPGAGELLFERKFNF